jgi:hypothetical protein
MGFKSSEFDGESLFEIAQTNCIILVSVSKWYKIVAGTSTFISFLNQSFSIEVNKKQEVGQISLQWQLHMFYLYFTNGCGNPAGEHRVVREHMYEMDTEVSENIPISHVSQPKKNRRRFFVLHWYFAGFFSHRNIISL